jgi:hypothetical protein
MKRTPAVLACAAALLCDFAAGQTFAPRSMDYLFAATANDARAIWVNPAGLAVVPEASLMGELLVHRSPDADLRLSQLSVGINSQGLSFGYNRERLVTDSSNHTYRIALARALQGWSVGFSVSHFRSGSNDTGFDAGIRYRVLPSVYLGVVLRNIGEPQIRSDTLPLTGVASLGWTVLGGALVLTGETLAQSRLDESGYTMNYRAGAQLSLGRALPIAGLTAVHLNSDLGVAMWFFGLSVGRNRRGVLVAGVSPNDPSVRLETLSLAAVATNPLTAWRRY